MNKINILLFRFYFSGNTSPYLPIIARSPPEQNLTHCFQFNQLSAKKPFNFLNISSAVVLRSHRRVVRRKNSLLSTRVIKFSQVLEALPRNARTQCGKYDRNMVIFIRNSHNIYPSPVWTSVSCLKNHAPRRRQSFERKPGRGILYVIYTHIHIR